MCPPLVCGLIPTGARVVSYHPSLYLQITIVFQGAGLFRSFVGFWRMSSAVMFGKTLLESQNRALQVGALVASPVTLLIVPFLAAATLVVHELLGAHRALGRMVYGTDLDCL